MLHSKNTGVIFTQSHIWSILTWNDLWLTFCPMAFVGNAKWKYVYESHDHAIYTVRNVAIYVKLRKNHIFEVSDPNWPLTNLMSTTLVKGV